jgi:hypothetical protein
MARIESVWVILRTSSTFGSRGDEAELAASDLHVAVDNHEDAEAGAVEIFDAGEIEDELVNAVAGKFSDLRLNLAQPCAEGHASGQTEDGCGEIDGFELRFENHVAGSPVCLQAYRRLGWRWEILERVRLCVDGFG